MTILTDPQCRALTFIRAANHGNSSPTAEAVLEWVERPDITPGKVTRRTVKAPTSEIDRGGFEPGSGMGKLMAAAAAESMAPTFEIFRKHALNSMSSLSGLASLGSLWQSERVITEREPDETIIEQLLRFQWIRTNATGTGLVLAELGRALLRADADDIDNTEVVVLEGGDPLAWGSLVGTIAGIGECIIVDPYLKVEQFLDIAKFTGTTRVILKRPDRTAHVVAWQVHQALPDANVEIRTANADLLHDRYIVGDTTVYTLGCSLGGVGRKPTTLIELTGSVADFVRETVEDWWSAAEPIGDPPQGSAVDEPGSPE